MTEGFYWHCHHDRLIEWVWDYEERVEYIQYYKAAREVDLRLRLFKPVRGQLPEEVVQALEGYYQAWEAYAQKGKGWEAYHLAEEACDQALGSHAKEIEVLHAQECPNCPWDGKTIFPLPIYKG